MRRLRAAARRSGPGSGARRRAPGPGSHSWDRPGTLWEPYGPGGGHSSEGTLAMPDPDSAAVARRNAAANGLARSTNPDQLVAQIERTRESLAQTIDELADRVSPSSNIRRLRERALQEAERPEVQLVIAAAGLFAVGYVVFRALRRSR